MNVAYCGILNENWTVAPTIYFLNFIILGEATTNWNCMESYWQLTRYATVFSKVNGCLYFLDFISWFVGKLIVGLLHNRIIDFVGILVANIIKCTWGPFT